MKAFSLLSIALGLVAHIWQDPQQFRHSPSSQAFCFSCPPGVGTHVAQTPVHVTHAWGAASAKPPRKARKGKTSVLHNQPLHRSTKQMPLILRPSKCLLGHDACKTVLLCAQNTDYYLCTYVYTVHTHLVAAWQHLHSLHRKTKQKPMSLHPSTWWLSRVVCKTVLFGTQETDYLVCTHNCVQCTHTLGGSLAAEPPKKKQKKTVHFLSYWTTAFTDEDTPSRAQRKPKRRKTIPKRRHKNLGQDLLSAHACPWDKEDVPPKAGGYLKKGRNKLLALQQPFELREAGDDSKVFYGGQETGEIARRSV